MLEREPGATILYNLICSWVGAGGHPRARRRPRPDARRPLVHQEGHGRDRRRLRRRALRPLLLPRQLPGRLGADRGRRGARAAVARGRAALRAARPVPPVPVSGEINSRVEDQAGRSWRWRRRTGRTQDRTRRADGRVRRLVVQRAALEHGAAPAAERRGPQRGAARGEDRRGPGAIRKKEGERELDKELLEILACPNDRGELEYVRGPQSRSSAGPAGTGTPCATTSR